MRAYGRHKSRSAAKTWTLVNALDPDHQAGVLSLQVTLGGSLANGLRSQSRNFCGRPVASRNLL